MAVKAANRLQHCKWFPCEAFDSPVPVSYVVCGEGVDELCMPCTAKKAAGWLLNAFSANMISRFPASVGFEEISFEEAREVLAVEGDFYSAVGHSATAQVLGKRLGLEIEPNRVNVTLYRGDSAILAQVSLPRLAEGQVLTAEQVAETLIRFFRITINPDKG